MGILIVVYIFMHQWSLFRKDTNWFADNNGLLH